MVSLCLTFSVRLTVSLFRIQEHCCRALSTSGRSSARQSQSQVIRFPHGHRSRVLDSFLSSAYDLPKETHKKVFKALKNFVIDPRNVGLHLERLHGKASDLWSIRVDDDYRIILRELPSGPPVSFVCGKARPSIQICRTRYRRGVGWVSCCVDHSVESTTEHF